MIYSKEITKEQKIDVLVVGGGPAGFGAAIAAARNGAETLLVERFGTLGGMATSGLVGPFMTSFDADGEEQLIKGIFEELCLRTEAKGGAIHPSKVAAFTPYTSFFRRGHSNVTPYISPILARVMDEMVQEAGVKVLFFTQFIDCITSGGKIDTVILANKDGLMAVRPTICIDCTGDADVAVAAGVPTWYGDRENENVAQPTTLFFEVSNIDRDAYLGELYKHIDELDSSFRNCFCWLVDKARENGEWTVNRDELSSYETCIPGRFKINTTRMLGVNATNAQSISEAMFEGRRQVEEVFNFMKKYVPGCANIELVEVAGALGVRETRHISGRYELTAHDVLNRANFPDSVLSFAYSIDVHSSDGNGGRSELVDKYYNIPFRSLVPLNCDNLLVAGRCISGSSKAASSFRVMPACIAMGQAAGTAAALMRSSDDSVGDVDVNLLQNKLREQGTVIK